MPSTRNLNLMPDSPVVRSLSVSVAALDAIIMPEWELRYYSFNSKWASNEEMASMRNGSGDEYFILFNQAGTIVKGLSLDSAMGAFMRDEGVPWPGVLDEIPGEFSEFVNEPAFSIAEATFCIWKRKSDQQWHVGNIKYPSGADPDGSEHLLAIFDGKAATYQGWAEAYYERSLPLAVVQRLYSHEELSVDMVEALAPGRDLTQLRLELVEIGYPSNI